MTQVTPRMLSPSMETIASVSRSTICPFCSDVNTSSISLTLMSGIALLLWIGLLDELSTHSAQCEAAGCAAGGTRARRLSRHRRVMRDRPANLPAVIELHDLDRGAIFDRAVVQGDRSDATEGCDRLKVQRRIRGKPAREVLAQRAPTAQLSVRDAE